MATSNPSNSSEKVTEDKKSSTSDDAELSDLLDSCLNDFDKPLPAKKPEVPKIIEAESQASKSEIEEFENIMKKFLQENDLKEEFDKIASLSDEASPNDNDFINTISETLKGLSENTNNIFKETPEDELAKLMNMAHLGESGGVGGASDNPLSSIMPFVQKVMSDMLSKDLLYPSMKDIVDNYPEWLEKQSTTLSSSDKEKYSRQHELMSKVCYEFEQEKADDSDEIKSKRFEKLLGLMQKIQECGHPPAELIRTGNVTDEKIDDLFKKDQCDIM